MPRIGHVINENPFGSIAVSDVGDSFLVKSEYMSLELSPLGIAYFKDFITTQQQSFQWFNTLLNKKALVQIERLNIHFVLSEEQLNQLESLLIETQLIIESRLLALPTQKDSTGNRK